MTQAATGTQTHAGQYVPVGQSHKVVNGTIYDRGELRCGRLVVTFVHGRLLIHGPGVHLALTPMGRGELGAVRFLSLSDADHPVRVGMAPDLCDMGTLGQDDERPLVSIGQGPFATNVHNEDILSA